MERISCRAHLDQARISDDSLQLHGVDERLAQSDILDAGVIEAINVVPDCNGHSISKKAKQRERDKRTVDFFILVLLVLNGSEV
jgi:hypothetical protein